MPFGYRSDRHGHVSLSAISASAYFQHVLHTYLCLRELSLPTLDRREQDCPADRGRLVDHAQGCICSETMLSCQQSIIDDVGYMRLLKPAPHTTREPARIGRVPKSTFRVHIVEGLREAILNGDIAPGSQVVEMSLAQQFGVSRGPLREAIRQLIEEGLLITVPYTGTRVRELSVADVHEIYSMRIALEVFAFEQVWVRRDAAFFDGLRRRHRALTERIDAGDDRGSILAELALHGFVYEAAGHQLLLHTWSSLRGRLQLYWAAHHRAHGMRGPRRDGHDSYVQTACGSRLGAMRTEIRSHMMRGAAQTEQFLREIWRHAGP